MERKCHCGEKIKSFSSYENKEEHFKAFHYFCEHCHLNFTALVYPNEPVKLIRGFIGKAHKY